MAFVAWFFSGAENTTDPYSKLVKVTLREVGNQLLLTNEDSTSLILPVVALDESRFELSFDKSLSFEPGTLVSVMKTMFLKSGLPEHYIVEVIQCHDHEVAYSYEMTGDEQTTIIPCAGRDLPYGCYTLEVNFINKDATVFSKQRLLYVLLLVALIVILFQGISKRRLAKVDVNADEPVVNNESVAIGSFQFFPEQNKLVKSSVEISLSRKECELLAIFIANPNQVIKRDELTKRVWEDNGVIVGRSLDTYISKIRKKLCGDDTIKLTNVHGVGYKLELMP